MQQVSSSQFFHYLCLFSGSIGEDIGTITFFSAFSRKHKIPGLMHKPGIISKFWWRRGVHQSQEGIWGIHGNVTLP
jgi:hypothetical protein